MSYDDDTEYAGNSVWNTSMGKSAMEWSAGRGQQVGPKPTPDLRTADPETVSARVDSIRSSEEYRRQLDQAVGARIAAQDAALIVDRLAHGGEVLAPVSMAEMRARPKAPYWLAGLVPMSATTVLAGPPGVGKSFLSLDYALSVASGSQSHVATQQGRVLYVLGEGSASFGARVTAWEDDRGVTVPDDAIDYLDAGVNLSSPSSAEHLIALCELGQYDLLIFDTWSQLSGVTDENSTPQTQAALETVRKARDTKPGTSALIVHHTDARGTKARGSTALPANTDSTVMIRPNKGGGFSLTTELSKGGKSRDGAAVTITGLSLKSHGASAVIVSEFDASVSEVPGLILKALADGTVQTTAALRAAAGLSSAAGDLRALTRVLSALAEDGQIVKLKRGTYRIA